MIRPIQLAPIVLALGLISGAAHATLLGRDLNGSLGSFEAYYDTDFNITWLADANYAKTSGSVYDLDHEGVMGWDYANLWATELSFTDGVSVYDNWRLPTLVDTGTPGCTFSYTGADDCGFNVDTANSEMAHLFHDELGNKALYDTSGNVNQPGWGLTNTGPFTNLHANSYWSDTKYGPYSHYWYFSFDYGYQAEAYDRNRFYALAVSPGDVGRPNDVPNPNVVSEPATLLLVGLGLAGFGAMRRRG